MVQASLCRFHRDASAQQVLVPNGALVTHTFDQLQLHVGILVELLGFFDHGLCRRNLLRSGRAQQFVEFRLRHCKGAAPQAQFGLQVAVVDREKLGTLRYVVARLDIYVSHHALDGQADGNVLRARLHQTDCSHTLLKACRGWWRRWRDGGMHGLGSHDREDRECQNEGGNNG